MNGGIDQLVDTYKGNPQPLAQKVQQAQQGQPPGTIPPDLEEAIALQEIAELRNSAQGQQAMQAGGAQQSVVEKLRQMLGGMQQQGQMAQAPQQSPMQGQPVMAARGGSIDQLMSNLGRHYAGGGIIAFQSAGQVKDPDAKDEDKLSPEEAREIALRMKQRTNMMPDSMKVTDLDVTSFPKLQKSDLYAKALANAQGTKPEPSNEDIKKALAFVSAPGAAGIDVLTAPLKFFANTSFRNPLSKEPLANYTAASDARSKYLYGEKPSEKPAEASANTAVSLSDIRSQLNKADAARFAEKPAPKPPADVPAAPRPTVVNPGISGGPAKPAEDAISPMEEAITKSIMGTLAKDPDEIRRKAIEANRQAIGLDALLKPAQDRAAAREAMIKQIQAGRQPLWITALQNAGNKPGNVAQVLNQMATGTSAAKQGYDTQDLKFLDELNDLYAGIDKAKIEGRYKDVAAGEAAVRDLISEKKQSEQSGTSLLNTKERAAATKQAAKDAAAARAQSASQHAQNQAHALEERKRQFNEAELRKIAQADIDRANKIEAAVARRTGQIDMQLQGMKLKPEEEVALLARRNAIVKQVMAEYPSAGAGAANLPPPPANAVREIKK